MKCACCGKENNGHLHNCERIANLEAENERLKGEVEYGQLTNKEWRKVCDDLQAQLAKVHSWCNRCGSLVVGDINHPCDKCLNHDLDHFIVDIELVDLQAQLAKYEWRSVEDGLPKARNKETGYSQRVYVCNPTLRAVTTDMYLTHEQHWNKNPISPYTHWMTIPDLPEQEVGNGKT